MARKATRIAGVAGWQALASALLAMLDRVAAAYTLTILGSDAMVLSVASIAADTNWPNSRNVSRSGKIVAGVDCATPGLASSVRARPKSRSTSAMPSRMRSSWTDGGPLRSTQATNL